MTDSRRTVVAEGVAPPSGLYSHAVRVSGADLLFVSGQTAGDADGNLVGEGGPGGADEAGVPQPGEGAGGGGRRL